MSDQKGAFDRGPKKGKKRGVWVYECPSCLSCTQQCSSIHKLTEEVDARFKIVYCSGREALYNNAL